jgi:hypothetical protein
VRFVPQPAQHALIANVAKSHDATIVFYTMEDDYTLETHEVLQAKLAESPAIEGVIFFRLGQFFYGKSPALVFLRSIVERGYEAIFARERLAIRNLEEFNAALPLILTCARLNGRDEQHNFFVPLLAGMAGR